jgi:hypothetical protein
MDRLRLMILHPCVTQEVNRRFPTLYSSGPQELADDLGLLAEEVHPAAGELLGRFPQTFSHTGLPNAAWKISKSGAPSSLVIMLFSQARPRGS